MRFADLLTHYITALEKMLKVERERDDLCRAMRSAEMQTKQQEVTGKESQLAEIEQQIGAFVHSAWRSAWHSTRRSVIAVRF